MATKKGETLLYEDISYAIRGACFDLYKEFGGVFKESVINKALEKELEKRGLKIEIQKRIDILYDSEKIGVYVPDIIVNNQILLELKVKPFISKEDERQFWHYLKSSNYRLGFLINFGSRGLEIKRRIYDKARNNIRVNPLLNKDNPRQSASTTNTKRGFTLIELLIAMMLFIVLLSIAVGGFIRALRTQRAVTALMEANDNVSFALEQMAREIRTGYHFTKLSDSELQFVNAENLVVWYRLNNGIIERGTESVTLQRTYKKITADSVKISNFNIGLFGAEDGDGYPPRITISLSVNIRGPGVEKLGISTNIQTTVSSMILDT
jgi:GxxExxY protein